MLEEKDLQAIAQLMDTKVRESESRIMSQMDTKVRESESRMMTYFDAAVMPKFDLLAEGQQGIMESLTPKEDIEVLESRVDTLERVVKTIKRDLAAMKKAQ